jgi:lipid-A-disaccharide synthase
MIKVKFISLVNLVMDKEVVKELIQCELKKDSIVEELDKLLHNSKRQRQLLEDYDELKDRLGNAGASQNAATIICDALNPRKK